MLVEHTPHTASTINYPKSNLKLYIGGGICSLALGGIVALIAFKISSVALSALLIGLGVAAVCFAVFAGSIRKFRPTQSVQASPAVEPSQPLPQPVAPSLPAASLPPSLAPVVSPASVSAPAAPSAAPVVPSASVPAATVESVTQPNSTETTEKVNAQMLFKMWNDLIPDPTYERQCSFIKKISNEYLRPFIEILKQKGMTVVELISIIRVDAKKIVQENYPTLPTLQEKLSLEFKLLEVVLEIYGNTAEGLIKELSDPTSDDPLYTYIYLNIYVINSILKNPDVSQQTKFLKEILNTHGGLTSGMLTRYLVSICNSDNFSLIFEYFRYPYLVNFINKIFASFDKNSIANAEKMQLLIIHYWEECYQKLSGIVIHISTAERLVTLVDAIPENIKFGNSLQEKYEAERTLYKVTARQCFINVIINEMERVRKEYITNEEIANPILAKEEVIKVLRERPYLITEKDLREYINNPKEAEEIINEWKRKREIVINTLQVSMGGQTSNLYGIIAQYSGFSGPIPTEEQQKICERMKRYPLLIDPLSAPLFITQEKNKRIFNIIFQYVDF